MTRVFNLPRTVCPQGAHSNTFTPAPLPHDTYLSLPEVYDWHGEQSGNHPYYVYHDEAKGVKVTINWKDAVQAIYRIANSISSNVKDKEKTKTKPLVGLYSSSGTLIYLLSFMGILRAGFPVFLISNRTSPAGLQHLISKSGVSHILTDEDAPQLKAKLEDVRKTDPSITVSYIPSWDQLISPELVVKKPQMVQPDLNDLCLVLHSSGSTALPELNAWTHRMMHPALWLPWYGEKDVCGQVLSGPSIPMSGAAGVMQALFTASSGLILSGFKPESPPIMPTPGNPFLAMWTDDARNIPVLAGLEGVAFGGGPLMKPVGDKLVKEGVNIFNFFGSSEAGLMNMAFPEKRNKDWEYFSFNSLISPGFRQDSDDGTVELIIKSCPAHIPTKINTTFDGVPAYATGDLLQPHPTIPGLWKYLCRVADQETIGPGRKVNAVALARILMADPNITGAVLVSMSVGSSIAFGAVIDAANEVANMPEAVGRYVDRIWPTIEQYNQIAPDPARLTKKRVILATKDKPFAYGEKGMPRRKDVIKDYSDEIGKLV